MDSARIEVAIKQMGQVQRHHPGLELLRDKDGTLRVRGPVGFTTNYNACVIQDTYEIEITLSEDFPQSPPMVKEVAGRIPRNFHHFPETGTLCLGAPVEVRRRFAKCRTLIGFINDQVIPFLYTYSCYRDYGVLPYGELAHGSPGLRDYYMNYFGTDLIHTLKLLKLLADDSDPPLSPCPCGNGNTLNDCHGSKLDELRPHYTPQLFEMELRALIYAARGEGIELPDHEVLPKRMWKREQSRLRKREKTRKRQGK